MKWDSILWDAETDTDANELRISIEAACEDMDERTFQQLQEDGVEVTSIKLQPEEATRTNRHTAYR